MAFVSSGYDPDKPMENRISDIGPRKYDDFYPPVIAANKGKWLHHEILKPGVLVHVAESGDKVFTVRAGGARLMSTTHIREICEIAEKHCDGYLRFTTRNNIEFMVDSKDKVDPLIEDLESRKFDGGSFKFPVGGTGHSITNIAPDPRHVSEPRSNPYIFWKEEEVEGGWDRDVNEFRKYHQR